jgi:hypothetical protein
MKLFAVRETAGALAFVTSVELVAPIDDGAIVSCVTT